MIPWEIAIRMLLKLLVISQGMKDAQLGLLARPDVTSIRTMWFEIYKHSVFNKVFKPIEYLPKDEKLSIWNYTLELAPQLNKEEQIKVSKCLYTIEYYLNNPL